MTTALYGDDPATEALEGLQAGDEVYFSFEGKALERNRRLQRTNGVATYQP